MVLTDRIVWPTTPMDNFGFFERHSRHVNHLPATLQIFQSSKVPPMVQQRTGEIGNILRVCIRGISNIIRVGSDV